MPLVAEPKDQAKQASEPRARMRAPSMPEVSRGPRVVIDSTLHSMSLELPGKSPVVFKAYGAYAMKRGAYSVTLKQTDPVWTAPTSYFLRRGLTVPPEGSADRRMKGVFGHQAIFLDKNIAIHSGPIWTDEIGGVKLSAEDMSRLFDAVSVGTKVEVR